MKVPSLLFIPGVWLVLTIPLLIFGGGSDAFGGIGVFILLSYLLAVPGAIVCGVFGVVRALRNWASGAGQMVSLFLHLGMIVLGGLVCSAILSIPMIGPH